jgi:hypothetical protein
VWKKLHSLELPSFPAEMIVIESLKGRSYTTLAANFLRVLEYIRDNVETVRLVDPSNSNNVVSDDLTLAEKQALHRGASSSLAQPSWGQIVW